MTYSQDGLSVSQYPQKTLSSKQSRILCAEPAQAEGQPRHLVVFVHGIGGSEANWAYARSQFEIVFQSEILIFCSKSVQVPTLGIDVLGCKLAEEVRDVVEENTSLQKISFIGHSLGGLVARYAIAILLDSPAGTSPLKESANDVIIPSPEVSSEDASAKPSVGTPSKGAFLPHGPDTSSSPALSSEVASSTPSVETSLKAVFRRHGPDASLPDHARPSESNLSDREPSATNLKDPQRGRTIAGLIPMNFITLASPHLGSRGRGSLPFLNTVRFLESASPALGPWFLGRTAKHLLMTDAPEPLLLLMTTDCSEGDFLSALRSFKSCTIYANVSGDQLVGWKTSSIRTSDMMPEAFSLRDDPKYPFIQSPSHSKAHEDSSESELLPAARSETPRMLQGATRNPKDSFRRSKSDTLQATDPSGDKLEDVMAAQLSQVPMKRVDVNFDSLKVSFLAHSLIQVKDYWIHKAGASIIQHIIDHFLL